MKKRLAWERKKTAYVAFMVKPILLFFICLSTYSYKVAAQPRFPVSSRSIIKPPYSTALSDYYTGTDPRLQLVLINMDITQPVIRARLRLNIISNKVNLRSKEFIGPIIELDAGTPQYLNGMDLAVYFNPNNIDVVSGLDYNALFKNPALPDGTYTFRFDVIEAFTGRILNNIYENQSTINILRCEPPFLNLLRKSDNIRYTDPLNIVFNWTPRALIKGMTEYEFSLYEINDNGMPPENAPFMSQPIYQTITQTTTLLYGPTEPPLLPGKKYAWRIRAVAKQGIDSYSIYNNDGYTETYWFQLNDNCDPPQQISATIRGGAVTLEWPENPNMYEYTVEYKKKGDWNTWFSTNTKTNRIIITDVSAGNTYEYRVGGICTVGAGATFSNIRAFTIPPRDSIRDKQCGILSNINLVNQKPLENLSVGESVMVGDFPATILSVFANGNNSFSGTAAIKLNIFNIAEASLKASFTNVVFNTDKQLIKGFMVTTFDSTGKQIADLDKVMEGGGDVGKVKTGKDSTDLSFNFPISKPEDIKVTINTDGTAVINVTGANGETKKITVQNLPTTIKDSEGNIYGVDKNGKVTKVGKAGEFKGLDFKQFNTIANDKATVTFVPHDGQQYAFDAWKDIYNNSQLFQAEYEKLNGYRVSSKAIEAAKTDVVKATIKINDNSIKPDSVRFVTGKGTRYESKYLGNNEYEITVVGGPSKDAQELYALYPTGNNNYLSFGKLLISSYPHKKQKLVLVPVNGAPVDKNKIADSLNAIYKKVAVEFEVLQDVNFEDHSWDKNGDGLDVEGSGLFSTLTNDMKALNKAYRDSKRPIDKSTIYLFVLSKASQQGVVGDMPRNKQFGYLFTGNDGKTVAHEVGHGLFNLKHTFDSQYGFAKGELGNNVMDYPNGNQFSKLQWDAMHDPGLVIGLFESDGDGKAILMRNYDPKDLKLKVDENSIYLLTPSNQVFAIHKSILQRVAFDGFIYDKNNLLINSTDLLKGCIRSFVVNNENYVAKLGANNTFLGYYKTNGDAITSSSFKLDLQTNPPFVNVGYIQTNDPCILTTSTCKFSNVVDWTSETILNNKQIISPECSNNPKIACLNQLKASNVKQSYTKQQLSDFADCINDNEIDATVFNSILDNTDKIKLLSILLEWPDARDPSFYAQRTNYNIPRNIEDAVLKIIKTISLDEASTFYTQLIQRRLHYAILTDYAMAQDERREFIEQLTTLKFAADKNGNTASLSGIEERVFVLKGTSFLKNYSDFHFNLTPNDGMIDNNEMLFTSTHFTWLGDEYNMLRCKSDDYILIFFDDNSFLNKGFKRGDYTVLPAYYLAYLISETEIAYKLRMAKYGVYIAFAAITLPELASSTGVKLLLNIGDLSEMALDVTLDQIENDLIAEVENGKEIVNALRTLQAIYVVGRLGTLAKSSVEYLAKNSEKLLTKIKVLKTRNINAYNKLEAFIVKVSERVRGVQNVEKWKSIQKIANKYPTEAMPLDGQLWGIAEIENGAIKQISNQGNTFNDVDFVITTSGELKIGKKHHFLGNASDVEAAGTIKTVNGKIKKISNSSGHYFPTIDETNKFPEIFRKLGLDTKGASLEIKYLDEAGNLRTQTKFITE